MTSRGHDPTRQNQNPSSRRPSDHSDLVSDQSRGAAHTRPLNSGSNDVTNDWFPKTARYQPLGDPIAGGMGVVFRALDTNLDIEVAIKRIRPEFMAHQELIKRFEREAKTQVRLRHPNLVAVRDFAQDELGPYIVMDWIKGRSLAQALKEEGPFEWQRAATIISKVAAALQVAHDAGIIHRDIKPANILLDEADEPHVTDFGLVRLEASQSVASETMTGALLGTVDFVAPEQLEDPRNASVQSDIWSLGATLYRLVTNRSVRGMRESLIPQEIRQMLLISMEDALSNRFKSMVEFCNAIDLARAKHTASRTQGGHVGNTKVVEGEDLSDLLKRTRQQIENKHLEARGLVERAFRYEDAVEILEGIPEHLRDQALYRHAKSLSSRVQQLEGLIKEGVENLRYRQLRQNVAELIGLQPGRPDLLSLLSEIPESNDAQATSAEIISSIRRAGPAGRRTKGNAPAPLEPVRGTTTGNAPAAAFSSNEQSAREAGFSSTTSGARTREIIQKIRQAQSARQTPPAVNNPTSLISSNPPAENSIDRWESSSSSFLARIRNLFSE